MHIQDSKPVLLPTIGSVQKLNCNPVKFGHRRGLVKTARGFKGDLPALPFQACFCGSEFVNIVLVVVKAYDRGWLRSLTTAAKDSRDPGYPRRCFEANYDEPAG